MATDIGNQIDGQLFLPLAALGMSMNTTGDSGFIPKLADRWHFEDSVTLVFHIDPRARWHDGIPVTAEDVAYTFDLDTDTLVNAPSRPLLSSIASVVARDSAHVVFTFTHVYSEQFYDATHLMMIVPQHLLDTIPRARLQAAAFNRHPVGNGPYRLVSWKPNESIELAADTDFYLGRPGIARLIWRVTPDPATLVPQLAAGEIDIIPVLLGPDQIAAAKKTPGIHLVSYPSSVYFYLAFNFRDPENHARPNALFASRGLRQAIAYAIDRNAIIQSVLGGYGSVPSGPTTPMVWIDNDSLRQLPFDSARARHMLDSLGWRPGPNGVRVRDGRRLAFTVMVPTSSAARMRIAVILQAQLKALGIDMEVQPLESNTLGARSAAGTFDAMIGGWQIDPVPAAMRQFWTTTAIGGSNYGAYSDPRFDSLVTAAMAARTKAAARPIWNEAMDVINNDAPAVWLASLSMVAAVSDRLENVTIRPDDWTATLWTWRIAPGRATARDRPAGH
ncbi:MAG TPA: ABC transporter substrate-binding protein [Gemmatimonadales bacterium]|nr:ABC transporter substrate-binding protein [Gemmatimonadales bacterium]